MKKLFLILITVLILPVYRGREVFASAETGRSGKDITLSGKEDDFQGCLIGDDEACLISLDPFWPPSAGLPEGPLSFDTTDVEGNPVNSEDLFSAQKVTMLKIWSIHCLHCIREMPELMKLNDEFQPRGARVVGIVYDADDETAVLEAKEIIGELSIDFLNLLPNRTIRDLFRTQSFPSTFFVNEKGEILGEPLLGTKLDQYEEMLTDYLGLPAD